MDQSKEIEAALIYESDLILDLELCWKPHPVQASIKNSIFDLDVKKVFIECGRKFGKTDFLTYILYRYALSNPNSACYYIAPLQKQAKELIWANNRLQNFFLPKVIPETGISHSGFSRDQCHQVLAELKEKYGMEINNTEMRIRFGNGSFIKLDGADQYEAYRGINPHIIGYDEFKDHHPQFHKGMDPNLATYKAPLIIVGTPPSGDENNESQFVDLADFCMVDPKSSYYNYSSYVNPYIDKDWLNEKKVELIQRGREDEWEREYMAKRVKSGSRSIFPMLEVPEPDKGIKYTRHVIPHKEVLSQVRKYHKDWDYFMGFDPASVSCFAVVFVAINSKSKKVLILDEVYEEDKGKMGTSAVFERAMKMKEGYPVLLDDVRLIYDNAAAWFANEVQAQFDIGLEPCMKDIKRKGENGKENRLNLIKEMLIFDYLQISDNCTNFIKEAQNYRTDEKGKLPKENDHLLDGFRYVLAGAYYDQVEIREKVVDNGRRAYTMEEDLDNIRQEMDPFERDTGYLYDY